MCFILEKLKHNSFNIFFDAISKESNFQLPLQCTSLSLVAAADYAILARASSKFEPLVQPDYDFTFNVAVISLVSSL